MTTGTKIAFFGVLIFTLVISACNQSSTQQPQAIREYVCQDGSTVLDSSECLTVGTENNEEDILGELSQPGVASTTKTEREDIIEDAINLTLLNVKCEEHPTYSTWATFKGSVKNNDPTRTASSVRVNVDFFKGTEWIDLSSTYVRNGDIGPGKIESFEGTVIDISDWNRCEAFVTYS